jgi:hypothetical protein
MMRARAWATVASLCIQDAKSGCPWRSLREYPLLLQRHGVLLGAQVSGSQWPSHSHGLRPWMTLAAAETHIDHRRLKTRLSANSAQQMLERVSIASAGFCTKAPAAPSKVWPPVPVHWLERLVAQASRLVACRMACNVECSAGNTARTLAGSRHAGHHGSWCRGAARPHA